MLLKPPYGIIDSEADENKNADCFWQSAMAIIFIQVLRSVYKELHADRETGC